MNDTTQYILAARSYLSNYYKLEATQHLYHTFDFIERHVAFAEEIAASEKLSERELVHLRLCAYFILAGHRNILEKESNYVLLFNDFAEKVKLPSEDIQIVLGTLNNVVNGEHLENVVEKILQDSRLLPFIDSNITETAIVLAEDLSRITAKGITELDILLWYRDNIVKSFFGTKYVTEKFSEAKDRNFKIVEKRIEKVKSTLVPSENQKLFSNTLNLKETEDLFKIAFRNYANLVAVADSKAGLLINVNSIIISVTIAFVVSRSDKYPALTWPSFILLAVSFVTVLLGILASRPQHNQQIEDKESQSYQTFFFGSFDLIDKGFAKVNWIDFEKDLDSLMKGGKENVYAQMYREAYNVRKVLSKKFTYLSIAYWVFIVGLFISIISFFIKTYQG
jgi:Family of unknown function (DUF5706)